MLTAAIVWLALFVPTMYFSDDKGYTATIFAIPAIVYLVIYSLL